MTNYFDQKKLEMKTSDAVDINQADNSTSLGFAVYPASGIIANFQPQSQVKAARLEIGDLISAYMTNDTRKVYTFIDEADMVKKTNGKNITIFYFRGNEINPLKESADLNTLIEARRKASIALDELIALEDNYRASELALDGYININKNKGLQTHYVTTNNNNYRLSTQASGNGTIINLGEDGSLYDATLRKGDIILTYKVSDITHIYIGLDDFSTRTKNAPPIGITYIKQGELGNDIPGLIMLIDARIKAKIELDVYLAKLKKTPLLTAPANSGNKNTEIENAIGAIILALALTISESNPKSYAKKEIGANTIIKALTDEQIKELKTMHYDPLIEEIKTNISPKRDEYKNEFNTIKTATGNKNSKKEGLIKVLNNLLINKRAVELIKSPNYAELVRSIGVKPDTASASTSTSTMSGGHGFHDPNDPQTKVTSDFYNYQNSEIEEHRRLINEIMNYLLEEKINIRYQWVAIKESGTKKLFQGKVGIISKLNNDNTNDIANKGKWSFTVWVPDKGGLQVMIRPNKNEVKTKLQIKDSTGAIVDKFHTTTFSIYDVEFLGKAYDPKNDVNYQPVIVGENLQSIKQKGILRRGLNKGLNAVTSISPVTGTYTNAERAINYVSARGLREDLKELIKDVIESKFTDEDDIKLLKTIITFYNKKKSIKDILISKISYIFASGETRLNLFNRKNLAKKFKPDEDEKTGGAEDLEGGGGYGFRNFDKNDAYNIIRLILDSLRGLAYEGIPASSRDLLFSTYLKKFLKIPKL